MNLGLGFAFLLGVTVLGPRSGAPTQGDQVAVLDPAADSESQHTSTEHYKLVSVAWDAVRKQTVAKIAAGKHVILLTSTQRLPETAPVFAHANSPTVERLIAGTECDLVSGSPAMTLVLKGIALHTAASGKVVSVRVIGLENHVVEARVLDAHRAQVLP